MQRSMILGLVVCLLGGCGSNGTTMARDSGGNATVTMALGQGGPVAMKATRYSDAKMPTDLPAWAPPYPGARLFQVVDVNFPAGQNMPTTPQKQVVLMTSDPVSKVMAFYDQKLSSLGIKPAMSSNTADGGMRIVSANGGQNNTMSVAREDGQTQIGLTYGVAR